MSTSTYTTHTRSDSSTAFGANPIDPSAFMHVGSISSGSLSGPILLNSTTTVDPTALPVTSHDDEEIEGEEISYNERRGTYAKHCNHDIPLYVVKSFRKISEILEWLKKDGGGVMFEENKPVTENTIGPIRVIISWLKNGNNAGTPCQTHFSLVMMGSGVYDRLIAKGFGYDPSTAPKGIERDFQICKFSFEPKRYPTVWKKQHGSRDDVHVNKQSEISFFVQLPNHLDIGDIQKQLDFYLQRALKFGMLSADSYSMLTPMKNREGNSGVHMGYAELKFNLTKVTIEQVIGMMSLLESIPWTDKKKNAEPVRMNVMWSRISLNKGGHKKYQSGPRYERGERGRPQHNQRNERNYESTESSDETPPPEEVKPGVLSTQFPTLPGQPLREARHPKKGRKPKFTEKEKETSHPVDLPVSPVAQPPMVNPMAMMGQMMTGGPMAGGDMSTMLNLLTLQMLQQMSQQMNHK